ncbi:MAG: hypothetical protein FWG78_02005 [Coriobacteriia bacterium]|nr:hypothetical protein [Coriobacteriia bacterium]
MLGYKKISLKNTIAEITKTPKIRAVFLMFFCLGLIPWLRMFELPIRIPLMVVSFCLMLYKNGYSISYAHSIYLSDRNELPPFLDWLNHMRRGVSKMILWLVATTITTFFIILILITSVFANFHNDALRNTWGTALEALGMTAPILAVVPAALLWVRYVYSDKIFTKRGNMVFTHLSYHKNTLFVVIVIEILMLLVILLADPLLRVYVLSAGSQSQLLFYGVVLMVAATQSLVRAGGLLLSGNLLGQYARLVYGQEDSGEPTTGAEIVPNTLDDSDGNKQEI